MNHHSSRSASAPSIKASDPDRETVHLNSAELLVSLRSGTEPAAIAGAHGLTWKRTLKADPDMHIYAASSSDAAQSAKESLAEDARVRRVYLNSPSRNEPFSR